MTDTQSLIASSACLILAAGKGTRMRSSRPKALQTLLGSPMLAYSLAAAEPLFQDRVFVVAGHGADQIRREFPDARLIIQERQLGTGHAVQCALEALSPYTHALILNADAPMAGSDWIYGFISKSLGADISFATIQLPEPGSYGRVARKDGRLAGIVEAKDFDPALHGPASGEVNTGIWLLNIDALKSLLPKLDSANKSGEYYLTDLVRLGLEAGLSVMGVQCGEDADLMGVNTPLELAAMEERVRVKTAAALLAAGVVIHAPQLARVSPFARVEPGAEITGPCEIYGKSVIHSGAVAESNCVIENSELMPGARVRSFSHISHAKIGEGASAGPFARLRPGAFLAKDSRAGNFVELKNAELGEGAKAGHLTYLGDARVGAGANIGAGTITCNYDGQSKHHTEIGENAFIGSNASLVAPVSIGDGALIGAGSVITHGVPAGELGIARARQKNLRRRGKKG